VLSATGSEQEQIKEQIKKTEDQLNSLKGGSQANDGGQTYVQNMIKDHSNEINTCQTKKQQIQREIDRNSRLKSESEAQLKKLLALEQAQQSDK